MSDDKIEVDDYLEGREDTMDDMTQGKMESKKPEEILSDLMDLRSNLKAKTEILNPKALSILETVAKYFISIGYKNAGERLVGIVKLDSEYMEKGFVEDYLDNMVSYNRGRSEEIIRGVIGMFDRMRTSLSLSEAFLTNLKDDKV
ncbi:MAG: hypothetical protein ACQERX_05240 [Bacillota bacterium]